MKNKVLIVVIIFVLAMGVIVIANFYNKYIRRDPIRIIEQVYDVELKDFNCTVGSFEEQWSPNGDGFCAIILKINHLNNNNELYLKSKGLKVLPINNIGLMKRLPINVKFSEFLKSKKGYYFYKKNYKNNSDFYLLIFDLENNEIFSYYEFM